MKKALSLAATAEARGEVPVGAVLVAKGASSAAAITSRSGTTIPAPMPR